MDRKTSIKKPEFKTTAEQLRAIWPLVYRAKMEGTTEEKWRNYFVDQDAARGLDSSHKRLKISTDRVIDEHGSLAGAARLLLLEESLCGRGTEATRAVLLRRSALFRNAHDQGTDGLERPPEFTAAESYRKLLQWTGSTQGKAEPYDLYVRKGFASWVEVYNGQQVGHDELFRDTFDGEEAIKQFQLFIGDSEPSFQPFLGKADPTMDSETAQQMIAPLLQMINDSLTATRDHKEAGKYALNRTPTFAQVDTGRLWSVQLDLARHLVNQLKVRRETRPVLVLPVAGYRRRDLAESEPLQIEFPDIPTTVARLRHFYRIGVPLKDLPVVKPLGDDESLSEAIQEIRLAMISKPAILVFIGVDSACARRTNIESQIADNDASKLISRLLDGPLCSANSPDLLNRWRRNCIIVMTDDPDMGYLTAHSTPYPKGAVTNSLVLSLEPWFEWMGSLGLNHEKNIVQYMRLSITNFQGERSELTLRLIDALIVVRDLGGNGDSVKEALKQLPRLDSSLIGGPRDVARGSDLVDLLLNEISKTKPLWLLIILLVSQAPDGLRRRTLKCVVQELRHARYRISSRFQEMDPSALNDSLTELCETLPYLVTSAGSDRVEGLLTPRDIFTQNNDFGPPDKESRHSVADFRIYHTEHRERAIQFPFTEIRNWVSSWCGANLLKNKAEYHEIHRVLAAQAIEQQTNVLRYADVAKTLSIRMWRRQFSAIYHGLLSLDIQPEKKHMTRGIFLKANGLDTGDLVNGGADFWLWLYFFAFRRQLERVPAYNLSRQYGQDKLKAEVLEFFDSPWAHWPIFSPPISLRAGTSLVDYLFNHYEKNSSLISHREACVRTYVALGDSSQTDAALERLREMAHTDSSQQSAKLVGLLCSRHALDMYILGLTNEDNATQTMSLKQIYEAILQQFTGEGIQSLNTMDIYNVEDGGKSTHAGERKLLEQFRKLSKRTEKLANKIYSMVSTKDGGTDALPKISIRMRAARSLVDSLFTMGWDEEQIDAAIDILFRLGALHGIEADLQSFSTARTVENESHFNFFRADLYHPASDRRRAYSATLAIFVAAESMRLRLFERRSSGSSYFASGHATRQMIRTAIELESFLSRSRLHKHAETPSIFLTFALQQADTLSRHLFRYPREQASAILIESDLVRCGTRGIDRAKGLAKARELIGLAEVIVLGLGRETRLRLRLASLRSRVHCELAALGGVNAEQYQDLCEIDVQYLEDHPYHSRFLYWRRTAERRRRSLNRLKDFPGPYLIDDKHYVRWTNKSFDTESMSVQDLDNLSEDMHELAESARHSQSTLSAPRRAIRWNEAPVRIDKKSDGEQIYVWSNPPPADVYLSAEILEALSTGIDNVLNWIREHGTSV